MRIIEEGMLVFSFSDDAIVSLYDNWSFYRNRFNNAFGGAKAVDIVLVEKQRTWLIEIKDYRTERRTKRIELAEEVALKVRDTLAGLAAAKCNADETAEKDHAQLALARNSIGVVLHPEQAKRPSKLFPRKFDRADVTAQLKQKIKAVDPHPKVVDSASLAMRKDMDWTVTGI